MPMLYFLLSGMPAAAGCYSSIAAADATRAQLFFVSSGINFYNLLVTFIICVSS
jgi:hypothetical protein